MADLRAAVRAGALAVATALLTQLYVGIILVQRRAPLRTFDVEQQRSNDAEMHVKQRPYDAEGLRDELPDQAVTDSRPRAAPLPQAAPPLPLPLPPLPQPDELTRQQLIPFRCD